MNIHFLIAKVEEKLGDRYPLATIRQLVTATVNVTPTVSMKEFHSIVEVFKTLYPDWYGYTVDPNAELPTYLLFRNRGESFDNECAVVTVRYRRVA